jgi:hypothetical protein
MNNHRIIRELRQPRPGTPIDVLRVQRNPSVHEESDMRKAPSRFVRWSMTSAAVLALAVLSAAACSPVLAAKQPSRKDVDLLSPGIPRNMVLAEFGQPVATETKLGKRVDVFSFVQGYRKGVKVGRTIGHGAADVMTLGLWEIVGTPTEATLNGHRVAYEVTYDASDRIEQVVLLKK